jgi:hypothetical protein
MDQTSQPPQPTATGTARRNEDIALDLLKFVAGSTNILRTASASTGFTAAIAAKPEDQVTQLLDLYTRCLSTVQGKP